MMTTNVQKTKKGLHPAAAAGVVIGAAGAAVTAALVHEPTRKFVGEKLEEAKGQVSRTIKGMQTTSKPIVRKTQDKVKDVADKISDGAQSHQMTDTGYLE